MLLAYAGMTLIQWIDSEVAFAIGLLIVASTAIPLGWIFWDELHVALSYVREYRQKGRIDTYSNIF